MERNNLHYKGFLLSPVEDFTIFTGFSCLGEHDTDRDLDDFIQQDAYRHYIDKIAITYSLTIIDKPNIPLAFATLQNDAIVIPQGETLPEVKNYLYRVFPAVKIGRFGVHIDMQRNQYGTMLLYLIKKMMMQGNRTGCRFLTVDARRDKKNNVDVRGFYKKNGFSLLTLRDNTSKYVPMYFDLASFCEL